MQVTTERLENCQVNVIVELDAAEVDKRLRQTGRQISRQFTVPGYRKGKAPLAAVIRAFGREAVQQQAIDDWGQELYEQALEQIEYEPYQVGELKDVEWDPFRMHIVVPIPPELDLGDYRSVRVAYEAEPVTEERIEEYLAQLQDENAQWVPVERPAAMGDQVVLDMQGVAGDLEVMNNQDFELLLEADVSYPLPGFQEQIVGMSPGEEKTFVLTVPEDDEHVEAAGQEATITARLHSIKQRELPPLDDELALMVGDYDTLDDLKAGVREQMETETLQKAESEYLDKTLDAFVEAAAQIEYPPQAVEREVEQILNQMEGNLGSSGLQLDTYLGMLGKTRASYSQELRPMAEERLKKRLVLRELVELEGLQIDIEEVEAEIERTIAAMGPQAEEMREVIDSPGGRMMIADDLIMAKAQERAVQIAKGEAPPLEEAAAEAETEAEAETGEGEGEAPEAAAKMESEAEADAGPDAQDGEEFKTEEAAPESPSAPEEDETNTESDSEE